MIATAAFSDTPASEGSAFGAIPRLKRPMPLNKPHKTLPVAANTSQDHAVLLERVGAARDKDAFVALFNYFAPRVKSYMLKQGASESAAEEIVQNTFITVWEKAKSYNPKKSAASTWIFTVARNKRIDALRRDKFVEVNSDDPAIEAAAAEGAETPYADESEVDRLTTAMAALPPEQAELVRMAFFDDKSHADISAEKKIPLGTVKSRLRLAMDKLRGALSPKGENK
ncbi:MAG: sigma-70 family RNA polymerase sigma factor [Micavibrio sp.]|nr:sigma-70 family RNA polymerase sigma factor [Micavibrio sp.]